MVLGQRTLHTCSNTGICVISLSGFRYDRVYELTMQRWLEVDMTVSTHRFRSCDT